MKKEIIVNVLTNATRENRTERTPIKFENVVARNKYETKTELKAVQQTYNNDIEELRFAVTLIISEFRRQAFTGKDLTKARDIVYKAWKKVLTWYNTDLIKANGSDYDILLTLATVERKNKETQLKETLPVSALMFRKNIENFVCDRIEARASRTAEQIEAEKQAKREKRKAERKAKKEKEKAEKEASTKAA